MADELIRGFDPIHLFVRTDEKYEEVRAEVHDIHVEQKELKSNQDRIEKRIDFGVAVTGQKNSDELARQAVDISRLQQTQGLQELKVSELEKTLNDKLDRIGKSVDLIYKGIVTIFFTLVVGGIVVYALKFFHFS